MSDMSRPHDDGQRCQVTLTFEMDRVDIRAALGAVFHASPSSGILCEAEAVELLKAHKAERGYIRWRVTDDSR